MLLLTEAKYGLYERDWATAGRALTRPSCLLLLSFAEQEATLRSKVWPRRGYSPFGRVRAAARFSLLVLVLTLRLLSFAEQPELRSGYPNFVRVFPATEG